MRHFNQFIAATLVGAGIVGTAFAQARPMPPDPYDPPGSNGGVVYPAPNGFPSAEVQAVPGAHARLVELRWNLDAATRSLYEMSTQLRESFEQSPEMKAAKQERKAAYEKYSAAKAAAIKQVSANVRYNTLQSLADGITAKIEKLTRTDPSGNKEAIKALAEQRLQYRTKASAIENEAMLADENYKEAQQKLVECAARVTEMREDYDRNIRVNPEFVAARTLVSSVKSRYFAANAFLIRAIEARTIALTYAYARQNGYYGDSDYGYGYGGSYGYNGSWGGGYGR